MALTERPAEGTFNGTTEVELGAWSAGTSTLLSFRAVSDEAPDRELKIRHKITGPTYTELVNATIYGTTVGAKHFEAGCPVGAVNASGESIVAVLDGAGTFRWQAVWLDRT